MEAAVSAASSSSSDVVTPLYTPVVTFCATSTCGGGGRPGGLPGLSGAVDRRRGAPGREHGSPVLNPAARPPQALHGPCHAPRRPPWGWGDCRSAQRTHRVAVGGVQPIAQLDDARRDFIKVHGLGAPIATAAPRLPHCTR